MDIRHWISLPSCGVTARWLCVLRGYDEQTQWKCNGNHPLIHGGGGGAEKSLHVSMKSNELLWSMASNALLWQPSEIHAGPTPSFWNGQGPAHKAPHLLSVSGAVHSRTLCPCWRSPASPLAAVTATTGLYAEKGQRGYHCSCLARRAPISPLSCVDKHRIIWEQACVTHWGRPVPCVRAHAWCEVVASRSESKPYMLLSHQLVRYKLETLVCGWQTAHMHSHIVHSDKQAGVEQIWAGHF